MSNKYVAVAASEESKDESETKVKDLNETVKEIQALIDKEPEIVPNQTAWCTTGNLRALWGLLVINTIFSASQMIGAIVANSLTMFSDSGSMLTDSFTYLINILMERHKMKYGVEKSKKFEAITSLISVTVLASVTIFALVTAKNRLDDTKNDIAAVNGEIVLIFALFNLLMDFVMCGNFCYQVREKLKSTVQHNMKTELNMISAFVHVFADTLRTLTGVVAGSLEAESPTLAISIDAYSTYIVCSSIIVIALMISYEAIKLLLRD